jgi:hypothetical protein
VALSVVYTEDSNGFDTTDVSIAASWASGDIVVVFGCVENALTSLNTPTATGLSFTIQASVTTGGASETAAYIWTAAPGSSGSGNITIVNTGSVEQGWGCAWVISGGGTIGNNFANRNETTTSLTVGTGAVVCFGLADWNANTSNQTAATGSGSATEREDNGNGSTYGFNVYDWQGTSSGSFSFGVSSYTGMQVTQVAIAIEDSGAAAAVSPLPRRRPLALTYR